MVWGWAGAEGGLGLEGVVWGWAGAEGGLGLEGVACQPGLVPWTQKSLASAISFSRGLMRTTSHFCRFQPWLEMVLKAVPPTFPAVLSTFYCLHRASSSCLEPIPLHCDCPMFILQLDFCLHCTYYIVEPDLLVP